MKPSEHVGGKRSASISGNDSEQDHSATEVPPANKRMKVKGNSDSEILAGSQSNTDETAEYSALELAETPEKMDSSKITTYIKSLSEHEQWMDLWSLLNTAKRHCQHHCEIFAKWRELRYPNGIPFDLTDAKPKTSPPPTSSGKSNLKTRTCAVLTYQKLVDSATNFSLPALRHEALTKLLDFLVMCYTELDDASMTDRLPDHVLMFATAKFYFSYQTGTTEPTKPTKPTINPVTKAQVHKLKACNTVIR